MKNILTPNNEKTSSSIVGLVLKQKVIKLSTSIRSVINHYKSNDIT